MAAATGQRSSVRQVFVVTLARSGSTLLRYLLDAHPEVTSPPELNLSALLQHAADTWSRTLDAVVERPPDEPELSTQFSEEAYRRARRAVDPIMVRCANLAGVGVFCDKSLTTVEHLETVSRCYPKASFIFLYRYPLDLIASGIEASRWGFNAFGFAPYVGSTPSNFVASLGNYWIDKVTKMVEFERTCTVPHARLYYELLCDDPIGTMSQLVDFLDLAPDPGLVERVFDNDHGRGPGDYKIDFTGSINVDSIGRGSRLPQSLGPAQVRRIDELLVELDYPSLEAGWRGDLATLLGLKRIVAKQEDEAEDTRIARVLVGLFDAALGAPGAGAGPSDDPFEVVVRGDGGAETTLTVDPAAGVTLGGHSGPLADGRYRIRCVGDVLLRVAAGSVNLAQAVHDGEIRVESPVDPSGRSRSARPMMRRLGALVRAGASAGSLAADGSPSPAVS